VLIHGPRGYGWFRGVGTFVREPPATDTVCLF
jgi:hypothetical protein